MFQKLFLSRELLHLVYYRIIKSRRETHTNRTRRDCSLARGFSTILLESYSKNNVEKYLFFFFRANNNIDNQLCVSETVLPSETFTGRIIQNFIQVQYFIVVYRKKKNHTFGFIFY